MQTIVKYIAVIHRILKILLHTLFQSIELMKRVYKENTLASRIEFARRKFQINYVSYRIKKLNSSMYINKI